VAKSQVEIVAKSLEKIKIKIEEELTSKNINFTGHLSRSMEINNTSFGATLSAERYLPTAFSNVGRGSGRNPFIDPDWLKAKGIQPRDLKTGKFITFISAAILISRKIGREGTDRHLGRREGVDIKNILKEETPKLLKKLTLSFAKDFTKSILSISTN